MGLFQEQVWLTLEFRHLSHLFNKTVLFFRSVRTLESDADLTNPYAFPPRLPQHGHVLTLERPRLSSAWQEYSVGQSELLDVVICVKGNSADAGGTLRVWPKCWWRAKSWSLFPGSLWMPAQGLEWLLLKDLFRCFGAGAHATDRDSSGRNSVRLARQCITGLILWRYFRITAQRYYRPFFCFVIYFISDRLLENISKRFMLLYYTGHQGLV